MWRGGCCDATGTRSWPLLRWRRRGGLRRRRWLCRFGWWGRRWLRRRRRWRVAGGDQLNVKYQVTLRRNHRGSAALSIRELVGNEEAALPTDVHCRKAIIPTRNDAADALLEGDGLIAVQRRVEFGSVGGEPAGVVDSVELTGLRLCSIAGLDI